MKYKRNKNSVQQCRRRNRLAVLLVCICLLVMMCVGLFADNYFFPKKATPISKGKQVYGEESTWYLILVNKWNPIPENYSVELTKLTNGQTVDKRIYLPLQEMFDAARVDGIYPVVVSGYRTTEKQQSLMDEKIIEYKTQGYSDEESLEKAEAWVAIPGTSEHQLGIAVDINAEVSSEGDNVYEWLNQNSYKFGFIHRYQDNKTKITGVINEPWHYRYVGKEAATQMYEQDICLEEYLGKH